MTDLLIILFRKNLTNQNWTIFCAVFFQNLFDKMMKELIKKFFEHIYVLFNYDRFISKHWPNYYNVCHRRLPQKNLIPFKETRINHLFWNIKLQELIITLTLITHLSYFYDNNLIQNPFWVGVLLYPHDYRIYLVELTTIWTVNTLLQITFCLSNKLQNYQFLWILHMEQIDYRQHYFQSFHWKKLLRFRKYAFCLTNLITSSIFNFSGLSIFNLMIYYSLFQTTIFWCIFWLVAYLLLILYMCSGMILYFLFS